MSESPAISSKIEGRARVIIESVSPEVDDGRFPAKRSVGDKVQVEADVFTDGHDSISSVLLYKHKSETGWHEVPMEFLVNDRWTGEFTVSELGRYSFTIHAWVDHWITWRKDLQKRIKADSDTPLDYLIGAELIDAAAARGAAMALSAADRAAEEGAMVQVHTLPDRAALEHSAVLLNRRMLVSF